jgi:hypothetical protein
MRSLPARIAAVVLVATLAIVVLADSAGAAKGCRYLKRTAVERAIDRRVKVGPAPTGVGGECSFTVRGAPADVVNVWVLEGDDAEAGFETGKELAGDDAVTIDGLGDEAVYTGSPFNTVYALQDGTLVYVQYYLLTGDASDDEIQQAVEALTRKVLDRV